MVNTTLEEAIQCEALWDTKNGITLCKNCHTKLHASEGLDNPEEIDYNALHNKGEENIKTSLY